MDDGDDGDDNDDAGNDGDDEIANEVVKSMLTCLASPLSPDQFLPLRANSAMQRNLYHRWHWTSQVCDGDSDDDDVWWPLVDAKIVIMLLTVTVDDNDDVLQCAGEVASRPYKEGLRI